MRKLLSLVALIMALAIAALPYVFGLQTETLYIEGMHRYAEAGQWRVHRSDFDRGWFRSVAYSDIEVGRTRVRATHLIDHGPLPFGRSGDAGWSWRPRQAVISTEALVESPYDGHMVQIPLIANTIVAIDGKAVARTDITARSRESSGIEGLSWERITGELHLAPASTTLRGSAWVPGLVLHRHGTEFAVADCELRFSQHLGDAGLPLGLTQAACGSVSIATKAEQPVTAERLDMSSRGEELSGSLRYQLSLAFHRLNVGGEHHGPGTWSLLVDRLDAASVSRLLAPGASRDFQLSDLLRAVATRRAMLESTLALSATEGKLDARVAIKLDEAADPANPLSLVTALDAQADLRAPVALVRRTVAMAVGQEMGVHTKRSDTPPATPQELDAKLERLVNERIRQWKDASYLVEEEDRYRLFAEYRKGVLWVNGNITDWMSAIR